MKNNNSFTNRADASGMHQVLPEWLMGIDDLNNVDIEECPADTSCRDGDLLVSYRSRKSMETEYRTSVLMLSLESESEEELYLEIDRVDSFRDMLLKRLAKVKLWNYPPDVRDEVKNARVYLKKFLTYNVPHGNSVLVPAAESEMFLAEEKHTFGIESCKYFVTKTGFDSSFFGSGQKVNHSAGEYSRNIA